MRHHNNNRKFGRESKQRYALMRGLMVSLIERNKIETTLAKAKSLRTFIEPVVTRAKIDSVHNRRIISAKLMNNELQTKKLFSEIAPKYKAISGGYTRIIKIPRRLGDGAEMAVIEFV
jgi:large subunit ribosomal protein L17